MATEDNLRDRAKEIRGAFEPSSVTNEAVGGLLLDIINFFIDYGGNGGGGGKPDARYWSKEELKMLDQYLYVLNDKIKALYADSAGDSELFKGHKWEDHFDQPVRTSDPVEFNSVTSPLFIFNELTTPEFVSGLLGAGTRLKDNHLELDEITVRKRMNVFELLIQRVRAVGGQLLLSPASIKIESVEELEDGYKCSFNTDDRTIPEPFVLNDQAFHQTFTGKGINRYWRLTTGAGDDYFILSKTDCEPGSGIPRPGDEVILLGNRTDKARQSAMMLSAYGNDAPYLDTYDGINDYNLSGKLLTREGNLTGIVDEVFGQLSGSGFYGKNVFLRGRFAFNSGQDVEEVLEEVKITANEARDYITNTLPTLFEEVDARIDGQVESFFENYDPTLTNRPASSWTTDIEKERHLNDTFTNNNTGASWKWVKDGNAYKWIEIADVATVKALAIAGKAQETADGKIRNFITTAEHPTPYPPYDVGDLWNQGDGGDIMCCIASRASGNYVAADWVKSNKYTDDAVAIDARNKANEARSSAEIAKTSAEEANAAISDMSSDDIISPIEKQALKKEWDAIMSEKLFNDAQADKFNVSRTLYDGAYNDLATFIGGNLSNLTTNWNVSGSTLRFTFKTYYDARTTLLNNIAYVAKQQAEKAESDAANAQNAADNAISGLVEANKQITSLDGKYTAQQSDITNLKTTVDAIPGKITQEVSGVIDWTKQYTRDEIGNLQIGGVNLLNGTDYVVNKEAWGALPTVQEENGIKFIRVGYNWNFYQYVKGLKNGKEYTISGLFRASVDKHSARFNLAQVQDIFIGNVMNEWKRITVTFTYTGNNDPQLIYILANGNANDGKTIDFANLQIEEGNKATVWKYSQEDQRIIAREQGQDVVNGMQIGARNLLLNSGVEVTNGAYNIKNYKTSIPLLPGKKYTVVIKGTTTGGQTLGVWFNNGGHGGGMFPSNMNDEVAFIHTTSPHALDIKDFISFYNYPSSGSAANPATIKWACLYEGHVKPPMDWVQAPEDIDKAIQDAIAKTIVVTAPSQVFKYGAGYTGTPTPSSIVLTANPKNFTPTSYQWQYLNGSTWTNISGATSSTYSIAPGNTTLFPSGTNVRTFRCICNGDEKLSDSFTIAKLADGATGSKGDKGDKGDTGTAGKGIKSITNYYLASASSSGVTVSTSGWTTTIQTISTSKRYLWNYEVVTYTDNSTTTTTPVIIGVYGNTGATGSTGAAGRGITSITEYYAVSSSNTTAPTSWSTTVPTTTTTNKYLWNYEKITYTDSTTEETTKRVIGTHGATGSTGAAGKDAYTVLLGNESHAFAGSTAAALAGSTTCSVVAYKGATRVAATIGTISGLPTGMTASVASNGTTTPVITFTVTTSMTTASGTVNIPVTVDGKTFTKVFSYSIAFRGDPGESINGKMLYKDPEFKKGLNGVAKYTNSSNVSPDYIASKLTVERVTKPSDAPTQSGYCLKITCKAAQSPGYGGVYQSITSRANAVFVQKIIAKIPIGYNINTSSNPMGTGYTDTWLTPMKGTGKYTTYLRKVVCGTTGNFSTGGHVYITGSPAPTESAPLEWYIAYMTAFDLTADGYGDIVEIAKTETVAGINNNPDSVTVYAKKTDFNSLNQVVNQQGSQLQVNTNSIDAIVTKNGSGTIVSIKPEMVEITGATVIQDGNGNKVNIFGIGDKVISVNGGVFSVDGNGKVIMQNAEIAGKITAKTGQIGDFTIDGIWLKGSQLRISGSQITFENGNNRVYLNSHPDMTTGGAVKLGTFVLTGGSYNGLESARAVALIAAAPSDNYSCAIAVTSGRVLMKGQIHFDNVVTYTGSGSVTITADSGHFIYLTPITGNPVVSVSSGLPIGSWFVIAQTSSAGGYYYIKLSGSDRFRRRGNAYQQVNSHNQDPSLIFKVSNTTWVIGNLPVNWIDWN